MYKHAGLMTTGDVEDLVWDDDAEAMAVARFAEPRQPKQKLCRCGDTMHRPEALCPRCLPEAAYCTACEHVGTAGDFATREGDETYDLCEQCGTVNSIRRGLPA